MVKRYLLGIVVVFLFLVSLQGAFALCSGTYPSGFCIDDGYIAGYENPKCAPGGIGQYSQAECEYENGVSLPGTGCTWTSTGIRNCDVDWPQTTCERYPGCTYSASGGGGPSPSPSCIGNPLLGQTTYCGVGACARTGTWQCTKIGTLVDSCTPGPSSSEQCGDGIDNDCDGSTDEGCAVPSPEVCDGVDNDLDGSIDEGVTTRYYLDNDGDGYGSSTTIPRDECSPPSSKWHTSSYYGVNTNNDCNDNNANINPGRPEICDGLNNDCVSGTPDGIEDPNYGQTTYCGAGLCSRTGQLVCSGGTLVSNCAPGTPVTEVCSDGADNDCDTLIDEGCGTTYYFCDADSDGQRSQTTSGTCLGSGCEPASCSISPGPDCNDGNPSIRSGISDICGNGIDENCNGYDEACPPSCTPTTEVCNGVDDDCDGSTDEGGVCGASCTPSTEVCDGVDNDCDGSIDEGGVCGPPPPSCTPTTEVCNGVDDDCDGFVDENGVCATPFYCDGDGDGQRASYAQGACAGVGCYPAGCSFTPGLDCNDNTNSIYTGAPEVCDTRDNDCDGSIDEGGVCTPINYYFDSDSDGHRSSTPSGSCIGTGCNPGGSSLSAGGDCNDGNPAIRPGATEICDSVDNDCDGSINEGGVCTPVNYFCDDDSDGYYDETQDGSCIGLGCQPGSCSATQGNDCNDLNPAISPGDTEICNNIDDDCDGLIDEGNIGSWYFQDIDGDGYSSGTTQNFCFDPGGSWYRSFELIATSGDCNDNNPNQYPGNGEVCDGLDNDCDGSTDEWVEIASQAPLANKQQGVCAGARRVCGGSSGWVEPNYYSYSPDYEAPNELSCDYLDNDCDGPVDELVGDWYYGDFDGDGWLNANDDIYECVRPGPNYYLVSESFQPQTDGLWDQDDSDPIITYEDCNFATTFIIEKNNYLGSDYATSPADDLAFDNSYKPPSVPTSDKYRGACTPTSNYCVAGSSLYGTDGITASAGTWVDGPAGGFGSFDDKMYCTTTCDAYGCEWLDYDSDQATCNSGIDQLWTEPGTNYPNLGEYQGLQTECCGDDDEEAVIAKACRSSTSTAAICCPNDGTDWFNLDGECVESCPDLMNSVDTFFSLSPGSDLYQAYELALTGNPNGYCCNGAEGPSGSKPLCSVGESGCYLSEGIPGTQDNVWGRKFYCQEEPDDPYCMVETCLEDHDYQVCEAFASCDDTAIALSYGNADQKVICDTYAITQVPVENSNYWIDNGCSPAQVSAECQTVTRTVCTPTNPANCEAVCQIDAFGKYNCQEVCPSYNCQTVTSHHGAECVVDSACTTSASEFTDFIDPVSTSSCTPFGVCNQFGCAQTACDAFGCPTSQQWYRVDEVCEENYYCTDLDCTPPGSGSIVEPNLRCFLETVDNGNPLLLNITEPSNPVLENTYYQCNPSDFFDEGDPWCDYNPAHNFQYDSNTNRCEPAVPAICDSSPISGGVVQAGTRLGCDNLIGTPDDTWGLYDSDCVYATAPIPNVYAGACCYAYSVDNFDVYDNDISTGQQESGIRIY